LSVQNGYDRCYYKDADFTDPVTSSNYTSGTYYCKFTTIGYRLLTEGEWEYAARAGTTTPFSCNETNYTSSTCGDPYCVSGEFPILEQYAVYCANYPPSYSAPVGSKLPNPWNLKDMHGNVWEWCWNWLSYTYPGNTTDYTGPGSGSDRVVRGGSSSSEGTLCRSAYRGTSYEPDLRSSDVGFRLVRSVSVSPNPIISSISGIDSCDQNGILIWFSPGFGATQHDLWVDGVETLTDITRPCFYNPGDRLDHNYVIRATQGGVNFDSNLVTYADVITLGAPVITNVTDIDGCSLSGVSIIFTAGSGATSHDLYVDGSLQASGITSPYTFVHGDANSHNYVVRAIHGSCWTDSNTITETDDIITSGTLYSVDAIVGNMRSVCAGTFIQGSPTDELCRFTNETQFNHTLTRNIAVMQTEVTRQMWADLRAVQPTLPADPTDPMYGSGMSNPAQNMSWYETVLFANLLSLQNGYDRCYYTDASFTVPVDVTNYTTGPFYCDFGASGYRLLSEGEWEYTARAGTTTPFSCNETNYTSGNCTSCTAGTHPTLEQYAVYCANDTGKSEPVGSKLPNPWNLSDMHGNVLEWCWDWYDATYPGDTTDYPGAGSGSYRVIRGGGWNNGARYCRSAYRYYYAPGDRGGNFGFRLVRSVN